MHRFPFVIEADEYDTAFFDKRSKFVHYRPRTAILNNLEFDHADIFDNLAAIERQFHHLVRSVPASGRLVVNADEESLQRVLNMGHWSGVSQFGSGQAPTKLAQQNSDPTSTAAQATNVTTSLSGTRRSAGLSFNDNVQVSYYRDRFPPISMTQSQSLPMAMGPPASIRL
jgi:UDP-N-acetylmuramate-alanine ligase